MLDKYCEMIDYDRMFRTQRYGSQGGLEEVRDLQEAIACGFSDSMNAVDLLRIKIENDPLFDRLDPRIREEIIEELTALHGSLMRKKERIVCVISGWKMD